MYLFYFIILLIAITGGEIVKFTICGINITYLLLAILFLTYILYFSCGKRVIQANKANVILICFLVYSLLHVLSSFCGFNKLVPASELLYDTTYIFRQSYYLFLFPILIIYINNESCILLDNFLKKYSGVLMWVVYIGHMIYSRSFSLTLTAIIVTSFLYLESVDGLLNGYSLLVLIMLLLTPIATGGELTNLLIRLLLITVVVLRNKRKTMFRVLRLCYIAMISAFLVISLTATAFTDYMDPNSSWRARFWADEFQQVINTALIGNGYGTTYSTPRFVGDIENISYGPFAPDEQYNTIDKMFVTASHNSYVSLFFRLGIVGITLFLLLIFFLMSEMERCREKLQLSNVFMFFSVLVLIGVNVGLESPYYLFLFIFSLFFTRYRIYAIKKRRRFDAINNNRCI